jgi:hypothetical protein
MNKKRNDTEVDTNRNHCRKKMEIEEGCTRRQEMATPPS